MKKILDKKGFTLIELLAVIVVLGIILAIAIPLVTGSINDSKKGSFISSAEMVLKEISKQNIMATSMGSSVSAKAILTTCINPGNTPSATACSLNENGYVKSDLGLGADYDTDASLAWIDANSKINVLLCATAGGKFDNMGTATSASGAVSAGNAAADCVFVIEK